jgi:hypothetical protein
MSLEQGPDESLKSYIMRFNQEKLDVESSTEEFIFVALYRGIKKGGPIMVELARKLPQSLQEFMDKAEEFINQEETLRAFLGPDPSRVSTFEMPKKKKKVNSEENPTDFKPRKKFKDYNFIPLNAPITEVFMEVKKDPVYPKPAKIFGKPPA